MTFSKHGIIWQKSCPIYINIYSIPWSKFFRRRVLLIKIRYELFRM